MELGERGEARLDDAVRPLVDLVVHVAVAADGALDRLLDDVGHLVHDELCLQAGAIGVTKLLCCSRGSNQRIS